MKKLPPFDRHFYYLNSVQSPEHDAKLLRKMYLKSCGPKVPPLFILQEDFCGTAALCYEWVQLGPNFCGVGVDLDDEALRWGQKFHGPELSDNALSRVKLIHGDVLTNRRLDPHIICALNFSYFFIRDRKVMLNYFKTAHKALERNGVLVLDAFGGPEYQMPSIDRRRNPEFKFSFWWEVEKFDAITHNMDCHIHFQRAGEKKRNRVFSYSWRLWGVPEITDILKEAGFSDVQYWSEGLSKSGDGDGRFRPVKAETNCQAWVCYLVARK